MYCIREIFQASTKEQAVFNAVREGILSLDTITAGLPVENARRLTKKQRRVLEHTLNPRAGLNPKYVATMYDKLIYPRLGLPVNNRTQAGLIYMAAMQRGILQPLA